MELTKNDTQKCKGIAIIGMVMLHMFCRLDNLPYSPLIWIGDTPLIYYLGLLGDVCVPIFCFCSEYAHYLLYDQFGKKYKNRIPNKLLRFLCNYWIVVVLFSVLGLICGKSAVIPGSLSEFLGNIFLYKMSYNGAWWFVLTYIFLLLLSPALAKLVKKTKGYLSLVIIAVSGIIYFIAYIIRFDIVPIQLENLVLDWILTQMVLLGTSQLTYMIGMVCRKYSLVTKLRKAADKTYIRVLVSVISLCVLLLHCVIPSAFLAPFTALATLRILIVTRFPKVIEMPLCFLGKHSTNIWLIHMFFYMGLFDGLAFIAKYPPFIAIFMFLICIAVSLFINVLYHPICHLITNKHYH